jgi:hypothetical protein
MGCGGDCGCAKCSGGGGAPLGYVFAIGSIEARFPSKDVEKEFLQAVTDGDTRGVTDRDLLYAVLSRGENLYLAREMCWVFQIAGIDTYILQPRSQVELTELIAAIHPNLQEIEYDVIIGLRGGNAPPQMCNGLELPVVVCNRLYNFTAGAFANNVPLPPGITSDSTQAQSFRESVLDIFNRMLQLADNAGETDEHRALNYISLKYPNIYTLNWSKANPTPTTGNPSSLVGVEVHTSRLSGARQIKDVVFTFADRVTNVQDKYFTRVDVTGQFPFLVSPLQPFYDR